MISTSLPTIPINVIVSPESMPVAKPKYCMECKSQLFKLNRGVVAFWQGPGYPSKEVPKGMGWMEIMCTRCKQLYNFYIP